MQKKWGSLDFRLRAKGGRTVTGELVTGEEIQGVTPHPFKALAIRVLLA